MDINKAIYKFIKMAFSVMLALLVVYGTVSVATVAYDYGYRVFTEPAMEEEPGKDVSITIENGMNGTEIGKVLKDNGLVRDENLFNIQLKLSAYADKIIPGKYTLNTSMTAKDMMIVMSTSGEETDE